MPSGTDRPPLRWAWRLAALLMGTAVAVTLAEVGVRIGWRAGWIGPGAGPHELLGQGRPWDVEHVMPHRELGWVLRPGFEGTVVEPGSQARLRVNSLGLRGPEPSSPQDPRWLVVGDSFTVALQVEEDRTLPALLEDRWGIQVWNGGVDSYSTFQATRWYEHVDEQLDADTVLLLFFLANDPIDNAKLLDFRKPVLPPSLARLERAEIYRRRLASLPAPLQRSELLGRLRSWWTTRLGSPAGDWLMEELVVEMVSAYTQDPRGLDPFLEPTRQALREFRDSVRTRGDRPLVVLIPPLFGVDPTDGEHWLDELQTRGQPVEASQLEALPRAVQALLDGMEIESCDLTPTMTHAVRQGEIAYSPLHRHWTARGHELAADAIDTCFAPDGTAPPDEVHH